MHSKSLGMQPMAMLSMPQEKGWSLAMLKHSWGPTQSIPCRRAERNGSGGGFLTGFVVGGAIFGALGFIFAPQISAALLSEDQRLKLPKFLEEEEKSPEATKQARRACLSPK